MMTLRLNNLTITDIARIGIKLDDPWGDGIRLEKIRNPNEARIAALAEVAGEPLLGGEELIRAEYEARVKDPELWTKAGTPTAWLRQRL